MPRALPLPLPPSTPRLIPRPALLAAVLLAAPVLAGCLAALPQGPSSIPGADADPTGYRLLNGTVWTADDARPWANAVAVRGDRIVAVGSGAEVLDADVGTRPVEVDLEGAMVLPGFHDTHTHFVRIARDTDPSEGNPYEPWPPGYDPVRDGVVGHQLVAAGHVYTWADHNVDRVRDGGLPAPPMEDREDGHGGHDDALHAAVERAAIDPWLERLDPDGDGVVRWEGRAATNDLGPEPAAPTGDDAEAEHRADWRTMLHRGQATAARFGITSHVEAGVGLEAFEVLDQMKADGELTARYNLYVFPEDLDAVLDMGWSTGHGDEDVRFQGLKIYSDGWFGPRTAALRELYDDRPHRGFAFYTQEEVDAWVLAAHQAGIKMTAHSIGDRATEMLLTAYERAAAEGCPDEHADLTVCADPRFSLEHVQLVQPDLVDRMADLGLVPSIQLSFATSDAPWAEQALGEDRLEHAYNWRTMHEAGLVVGGSSDFPIEVLHPLWGIQRVVTREDLDGQPDGGFQPDQALTLEQALRSVTINAAYLEHREDELGSVTPGKYADLVVLERDLFDVPPDEIAYTDVWLTMVGGRVVHADGPLGELGPGPGRAP